MAGVDNIEAKEAEMASWVRTAKDLTAGAAGGIAQVLLGEYWSTCACARDTCDSMFHVFLYQGNLISGNLVVSCSQTIERMTTNNN